MPDGLRGEWWIDDSGSAIFADGDIGDQGHEIIAFWAALGVDPDEAFESLGEAKSPYKRISEGQASVLLELGADPKAVEFFSGVEGDAREFMMVEHAWIRVANSNFQLWNLDDEALGRIRDFINDEYPEDEDPLEDEFQIEELRKEGVHLSVSGADLLESGKSADALKYSAQRERTGMYNPPKIQIKVQSRDSGILIKMFLGPLKIGQLLASEYLSFKECLPEVEDLQRRGYNADAFWCVYTAGILEAYQGMGYGKQMYEAFFDEVRKVSGTAFVGPRECTIGSGTSRMAKRVWNSLTQKYPSAGHVLFIGNPPSFGNNPEKSERTYYEIGHRGLKSKLWYGDEFNINVEPAEFDIDDKDVDPRNLHNEWALRMPWHGRYDPYSGEVSIMGGTMTEDWRQPSEQMLDRLRETFGADVQIVQFNPGAYNPRRGFR